MIASACPDQNHLSDYLLGRIKDHEAEYLESHLSGCTSCVRTLDSLCPDDVLLSALRSEGRTPQPSNRKINELRSRMEHLFDEFATRGAAASSFTVSIFNSSETNSSAPKVPVAVAMPLPLAPPQEPGELGRLGPYRVLEILGSGGMGMVLKAEDPALKRLVALKVMRTGLAGNAEARERFLREGRAMAALSHDHIVPIYQVGEDRGVAFLAMPLLQGEMLEKRLQREVSLPLGEALRIGRETALGLATAHERGMIHRDIKPGNLWLEAPQGRIKILDFGLARQGGDGDPHLTDKGTVLGTPSYMAPEQADGKADHRADLFSLGCVLYRMTTGRLPFEGASTLEVLRNLVLVDPSPPQDINPEVPAEVGLFIKRLLEKDPTKRPVSAAVAGRVLDTLQQKHAPFPVAIPLAQPVLNPKAEPRSQLDSRAPTQQLVNTSVQTAIVPTPPRANLLLLRERMPAWLRTPRGLGAVAVSLVILLGMGVILYRLLFTNPVEKQTVGNGGRGPNVGGFTGIAIDPQDIPQSQFMPIVPIPVGAPMADDALVSRPASIPGLSSWDYSLRDAYTPWSNLGLLSKGCFYVLRYPDRGMWLHGDLLNTTFKTIPGKNFGASSRDQKNYLAISNNIIHLFDAKTNQLRHTLRGHTTDVLDAQFSPDGQFVGSVSANQFKLWRVKDGRVQFPLDLKTKVLKVTCSGDGNVWAVATGSERFGTGYLLVNVENNHVGEAIMTAAENAFTRFRLSPDGKRLLLHLDTGAIRILNASDGKEIFTLQDAATNSPHADWSPNGRYITYAGTKKNILIVDVSGDKPEQVGDFRGHGHLILEMLFAQDMMSLISLGDDGTIRFWNLADGKQRGAIVYSNEEWIAVSAEGHFIGSPGILEKLNVRVQPIKGDVEQMPYETFVKKYGWKNDPKYVRLLNLTQK